MKLWLVGGDEYLPNLVIGEYPNIKLDHWDEKAKDGRVRYKVAPQGVTHVVVMVKRCFNEMAHAARNEARRLGLPFASVQSNPLLISQLATWGAKRKLKPVSIEEARQFICDQVKAEEWAFAEGDDRKMLLARVLNAAEDQGLNIANEKLIVSTLDTVAAAIVEKARTDKAAKEEEKAKAQATKAVSGLLDEIDSHADRMKAATLAFRQALGRLNLGREAELQQEIDDLRAKLKIVQEATQL